MTVRGAMDFMNTSNGQNPGIVPSVQMRRKIGRVLSIDIIQHAGARESGRFCHSGRRYTLFRAFFGGGGGLARLDIVSRLGIVD